MNVASCQDTMIGVGWQASPACMPAGAASLLVGEKRGCSSARWSTFLAAQHTHTHFILLLCAIHH